MRVKALLNQQDRFGRVFLIDDVFEIDDKDFNPKLHSKDVQAKRKVTGRRKQPTNTEKPNVMEVSDVRRSTVDQNNN